MLLQRAQNPSIEHKSAPDTIMPTNRFASNMPETPKNTRCIEGVFVSAFNLAKNAILHTFPVRQQKKMDFFFEKWGLIPFSGHFEPSCTL